MTAVLTDHATLILPAEVCREDTLPCGTRFDVTVTAQGDLLLRRERPRKMSLMDHLRGMEGLEIQRERETVGGAIKL